MTATAAETAAALDNAEKLRTAYFALASLPDPHPLALEREGTVLQKVAAALYAAILTAVSDDETLADDIDRRLIESGESVAYCYEAARRENVTVFVENAYTAGHACGRNVTVAAPGADGPDDDWWEDVVFPATGCACTIYARTDDSTHEAEIRSGAHTGAKHVWG